jgi:hypothetical protein
VKLIGQLTELELIKKTVRTIKKVFVDNIYHVAGFMEVQSTAQREKHSVTSRVQFLKSDENKCSTTTIIPPLFVKVKPFFEQISLYFCKTRAEVSVAPPPSSRLAVFEHRGSV